MKKLLIIIALYFFQEENHYKKLPGDLKKLDVISIFNSDEVLRIWRFPEGGAAFEELFEFRREDHKWYLNRYTYLIDEFSNEKSLQKLRKRKEIKLDGLGFEVSSYVNKRLLYKNVLNDSDQKKCLCDSYRAEYRLGNQGNIFTFDLEERQNINKSKELLIKALKKIVEEY